MKRKYRQGRYPKTGGGQLEDWEKIDDIEMLVFAHFKVSLKSDFLWNSPWNFMIVSNIDHYCFRYCHQCCQWSLIWKISKLSWWSSVQTSSHKNRNVRFNYNLLIFEHAQTDYGPKYYISTGQGLSTKPLLIIMLLKYPIAQTLIAQAMGHFSFAEMPSSN